MSKYTQNSGIYGHGIIDAHLHLGEDIFRKKTSKAYEAKLQDLIVSKERTDVEMMAVMPMPSVDGFVCPNTNSSMHLYGKGFPEVKNVNAQNNDTIYEIFCPVCKERWKSKNPYGESNEWLLRTVEKCDFIIPGIIVRLDDPNTSKVILNAKETHDIKFVKLYPLLSDISPLMCVESNPQILDILRKYDIPVIIHTDKTPLNANPINCMEFSRYNIKTLLAHGARGHIETLKEIDKNPNLWVDISPLSSLSAHSDRMFDIKSTDTEKLLQEIISYAGIDKVIAGTDWPWGGNWNGVEGYLEEWKIIFKSLREYQMEKVLHDNAIKFFGL